MKSKGVAYLLWFLGGFGIAGWHRFYLGKVGTGLLWMFTLGLVGVGAFIDMFTLGGQVDLYNATMRGAGNVNTNAQNVVVNVTSPTTAPQEDAMGKLEKLGAMRDAGHLTEEEYAEQKAKVLSA